MKNNKINVKSNKGITGADITIAVVVIALFTGLIANLMYNSYKLSLDIQKAATANAYATIVLEKIDEKTFDEVSNQNFLTTIKNEITDATEDPTDSTKLKIGNYTIAYSVSDYSNYTVNNNPIFKKITLTVTYDNGDKTLVINKLKVREIGG